MHQSSAPTAAKGAPARRGRPPLSTFNMAQSTSHPYVSANPSERANASFTSSLSIAVEGTTPILDSSLASSSGVHAPSLTSLLSSSAMPADARRAPRKSKTDALAALNVRSRSPSYSMDEPHSQNGAAPKPVPAPVPSNSSAPIPVDATLDMNCIKTDSPRDRAKLNQPRPFGLTDCPTFYPTEDQFKDPVAFIRSIAKEGQEHGICKVVPPQGWKMPFVTNTADFRFKTRLQRLNSIEASSRAKINFLEALYRFHKQQGNPRVTVPTINHKPLDLWSLRKEVNKLGGFDTVNKAKKWVDVGRLLGYGGIPGLSTQLRNSYIRVILPFEHFSDGIRKSPTLSTNKDRGPDNIPRTLGSPPSKTSNSTQVVHEPSSPRIASPMSITSSPLSEPPDMLEANGNAQSDGSPKVRRAGGMHDVSQSSERKQPKDVIDLSKDEPKKEDICEICQKDNRPTEMLLCDGCDCGFHTFCLVPPLSTIPKGQWFCHSCLFGTGGDFGFDEGEEHCLSSFQARDRAFREKWFAAHKPPQATDNRPDNFTSNVLGNVVVSETDVENEFWRLVQSPYETVEIEYGADVHSTTHGSAMPTMETHPLDPYSRDPWNLNNIPILSESLLRYIKSEISGMTVPWTYVGMVFSTFCWHNEDHYTYSINFMHWGETKTWYGIPGDDAEKFEAAIRKEAPDLFETQPDLLFQLVTLMNPGRLTSAGVRVYACNQRAGEFVITFPRAYHAGFNHGLNFNEAVNFALPDWLSHGLDCVRRYQEHKKHPVFSHDELIVTITQQSSTIQTAIWIVDNLDEMVNRELIGRNKVRALAVTEVSESVSTRDEQYQCLYCKAFCYLSRVSCSCPKSDSPRISCLDHMQQVCDCPIDHRVMHIRYTDAVLEGIRTSVAARASVPDNWRKKYQKMLAESAKPPLRVMRTLVGEADRINYPLPELQWLRACVAKANEWVDAANSFTTRKQSRKRSKRQRWPTNGAGPDDKNDRPDKTVDDLATLLSNVVSLGFDSPEIIQLQQLENQVKECSQKARTLLQNIPEGDDRAAFILECETLLAYGSSLNVHVQELYDVESIVLQEQLVKEMQELEDTGFTLDEVRQFLARAKATNLSADHKYMKLLESKLQAGNDWDEKAGSILTQPVKTIEELNQFIEIETNTPVDPIVLNRLTAARMRALDYERQANAWLAPEPNAELPKVQDVLRLVQRAEKEFSIPAVGDLRRTADFASDLEDRCERVLKNRFLHPNEGSIFDEVEKWSKYAQEHLTKFALPSFNRLIRQTEAHNSWEKKLPWFCNEHERPHITDVLNDVLDFTKPEDDAPPNDEFFTCICFFPVKPPPPGQISDAVQCDHCFARFHGRCAANGGSCPFCDPNHWNGNIHKERSWHFYYLPLILDCAPEITKFYADSWKDLKLLIQKVDRLAGIIKHFLAFASQAGNHRQEYMPQVKHYMRKLYKLQFAIGANPENSYGLDLAGLHRLLAIRPAPMRIKKRRRPKFVFGQDIDKDWKDRTRCICRGQTPYLLAFPNVECSGCSRRYHLACVCLRTENKPDDFSCPLCCLRKCKPFPFADIRVKFTKDTEPDVFIDVKSCIENFSRDLIRFRLDPPKTSTIFIDLMQFTPGQPDAANGRSHPSVSLQMTGYPGSTRTMPVHILPQRSVVSHSSGAESPVPNVPPPPPWSRMELPPPPSLNHRTSPVAHALSPVPVATAAGPPVPARPSPSTSSDQTDPLIPFKRKRKASVLDGSHDSVYVFEVEQPNTKRVTPSPSPTLQQRSPTTQSNSQIGSPLNIIVQDSLVIAQQSSRVKTSPTVTHQTPPHIPSHFSRPLIIPPSVLPSRDRTTPSDRPSPGHSGFKIRLKVKEPVPH